ncbi:MAG: hypothetical protein GWO20_17905, partial [Candidatus Korarchaeota archaeon]|nr:hypothetical protein [Candidatus Korarchaeota archaeon]NIW15278.1 hypothetical protein [Candidatus Thorarchaeota archaeon]
MGKTKTPISNVIVVAAVICFAVGFSLPLGTSPTGTTTIATVLDCSSDEHRDPAANDEFTVTQGSHIQSNGDRR